MAAEAAKVQVCLNGALPYAGITRIRYKGLSVLLSLQVTDSQSKLPQR